MSHKFLIMMGKIEELRSLPVCKSCQSCACERPGNCDDFQVLDKAIRTCSMVSHHFDNLEELEAHGFSDLKSLSKEQLFLA